jgi:hypothetical protein
MHIPGYHYGDDSHVAMNQGETTLSKPKEVVN